MSGASEPQVRYETRPQSSAGAYNAYSPAAPYRPWDPSRFEWADEEFVDMILTKMVGDHKVRTREELEAVMNEPFNVAPTREVWVHESLQDEARRLWEQMVADL